LRVSTVIFKHLHHEPVDFDISQPELDHVEGPLASANIALPWLIFFRHLEWLQRLSDEFTALSYMATGGISHRLPIARFLYRMLFAADLELSRRNPGFCASFFTVSRTRR
jgi:hypothetical protein